MLWKEMRCDEALNDACYNNGNNGPAGFDEREIKKEAKIDGWKKRRCRETGILRDSCPSCNTIAVA